jgi:flagellar motor protein MotB
VTDDHAIPEPPEEESYFVSMTDIMVGLLFVFIIMLMTFALQYRGATATVRDADELVDEAKRTLLTDVVNLLTAAGVPITVNLEQGVIHLPESVLFEPARAELPEKGRLAVNHVRAALAKVMPCYAKDRPTACESHAAWLDALFIEGHSDSDRIRDGSRYRDNLELSAVRAVNTYRELIAPTDPAGLADAQTLKDMQNRDGDAVLAFSGYGDQRPIDRGTNAEAKARNRRIDLRFLMATLRPPELDALAVELRQQP